MHSATMTLILLALSLMGAPASALAQTQAEPSQAKQAAQPGALKTPASTKPTRKAKPRTRRSLVSKLPDAIQPSPPAVSLVSGPPEYLAGEASVIVKGNENPIVRLGLAASGVTLIEFPASDRFFALHPGNSDMVTIDESPTKQSDHFFVFRAGSTFVIPPASHGSAGPAASIIAQMRSGMVVTLLIYPVRELQQMAHRVVILYDRAEVVAARRAAGLAVNLEERLDERRPRSIRIAGQPLAEIPELAGDGDNQEGRPRSAGGNHGDRPSDNGASRVTTPPGSSERSSVSDSGKRAGRDLESEARKALKLAITSSKFKNWTEARHGLSIATSIPKGFNEKDGAAIVIVAVSNILPEPLSVVPGQPDLSVETRDEDGKKTLLVEQMKPLYVQCSGIGDSIPARSTLYYAIVYRWTDERRRRSSRGRSHYIKPIAIPRTQETK